MKRVKALRYFLNETDEILECRNFRDQAGAMLVHPTRLKKFDPNAVIREIMEIAKVKTFTAPPVMTYEAHGDETF